jgi:hypothetical protein
MKMTHLLNKPSPYIIVDNRRRKRK